MIEVKVVVLPSLDRDRDNLNRKQDYLYKTETIITHNN